MENQHLITYAMMSVNDSNNVDYFDSFVPFIKEALLKKRRETISANDIKDDIKELFDLNLPINVVNTILRRKLRPRGYVKLVSKTYKPDFVKLQDSTFDEKKLKLLEQHERLISDFIDFAKYTYNLKITIEQAESVLKQFIENHQLNLLDESNKAHNIELEQDERKFEEQLELVFSKFVQHSIEHHLVNFDYLINIVKGTMLTNLLYYNDLSTVEMKFKGTEVFFDSSFIVYALGLAGQARQEPCLELISMLRESSAILRVFRHNIEEIIGIIEWCKNNLTSGASDFHGTIAYFNSMGYGPSEVERFIYALEGEIEEKLKIKIVDQVDFEDHQFVIDEAGFTEQLKNNMKYTRINALERDVQSVSAIMRLRKGKQPLHVESSRAVFITSNFTLAHQAKTFFMDEDIPRLIPPVLHDSIMTNLVWLKNPSRRPNLPEKLLIADCYAAVAPKEHVWARYLETVRIYESTNEISKEDLVLLRYSHGVRELLVDKTLGDEDAITIGTVQEILEEIKSQSDRKAEEVRIEKELEIDKLKQELEKGKREASAAKEQQEMKLKEQASKKAKLYTKFFVLSGLVILGTIIYFIPFIKEQWLKNILIVVFSIIPTILGLVNINAIPLIDKFELNLSRKFERNIKRKYY
ncbi:cell envelope integrity protein TolA [Metabacillus fastidiosus]|uniref:cell envelope integrity protein TolA n=1 Tax=Metabacillus fastidiosus TaxID=1458 RepID=UPI002E21A490|nr:cell envelope integrity protein TolA [Metabacillus fastidiosus]